MGRARFLVPVAEDDELFYRTEWRKHAHSSLRGAYRHRTLQGLPSRGHAFDAVMQDEAWAFLAERRSTWAICTPSSYLHRLQTCR